MRITRWKESVLFALLSAMFVFFAVSFLIAPQRSIPAETLDRVSPQNMRAEQKDCPEKQGSGDAVLCGEGNVTLKEYGGKVGVYSPAGMLIHVIDTQVDRLPEGDRADLMAGIVIEHIDLPFAIESLES